MATQTLRITDAHRRQFAEEGYFILEAAIPPDHLAALGIELENIIQAINARMDELGTDIDGLNHRDKRYFIGNLHLSQPRINEFLHSPLMADVCRATLGPDAWHFFNQYVVKFAEVGSTFQWHQDSGYVAERKRSPHKPYLTCWCPLDDVDESNGTIYVLPFSRTPDRGVTEHRTDEKSNDLVGYFGDDPGDPVVVPAGSVVVFSSLLLHRSGPNTTDRARRVFLAQYSAEPIMRDDDPAQPILNADPFLRDGRPVGG
jgi:ectoine hydroxylase-related dioxygenase (phytanoyl-CoA dioxygenase family)